MKNHLSIVRTHLQQHGADAAVLTFLPHIRWACGFTGSNGLLIVGTDEAHFLSDGRYEPQAHREVKGPSIHIAQEGLLSHAAEQTLLDAAQTVLFQSDHVTVTKRESLGKHFPSVTWTPVTGLLDASVAAKDLYEVEHVRAAQAVTDDVFEHVCDVIEPGMTERALAAEIVYQHLRRGAERMAFDPIVASGPNGSLPHARPSNRKLQRGDLVVIDMGGVVDGYASDMTRTVAIGQPAEAARSHYEAVLNAQRRAIEAAHAGMTGTALDAVARTALEEAGIGEYFTHSLGHGIGLQTHEWPRLSQRVEHVLPEGATVTIEPGVYIPERYGIRIEDIVVLKAEGCENLTTASKELLVL